MIRPYFSARIIQKLNCSDRDFKAARAASVNGNHDSGMIHCISLNFVKPNVGSELRLHLNPGENGVKVMTSTPSIYDYRHLISWNSLKDEFRQWLNQKTRRARPYLFGGNQDRASLRLFEELKDSFSEIRMPFSAVVNQYGGFTNQTSYVYCPTGNNFDLYLGPDNTDNPIERVFRNKILAKGDTIE